MVDTIGFWCGEIDKKKMVRHLAEVLEYFLKEFHLARSLRQPTASSKPTTLI